MISRDIANAFPRKMSLEETAAWQMKLLGYTDEELADLADRVLWPYLNQLDGTADLVDEMIDRLRRSRGPGRKVITSDEQQMKTKKDEGATA